MRVSEKTLELNIGAEILYDLRNQFGGKVFLRGLTQTEESKKGVDFYAGLNNKSRMYAFQFKSPIATYSSEPPYKYRINRRQHANLLKLTKNRTMRVQYVFPFYSNYKTFKAAVPKLLDDTWFLDAIKVPLNVFCNNETKIVNCMPSIATINPDFPMLKNDKLFRNEFAEGGIPRDEFIEWYHNVFEEMRSLKSRKDPWLFRGLHICIIEN